MRELRIWKALTTDGHFVGAGFEALLPVPSPVAVNVDCEPGTANQNPEPGTENGNCVPATPLRILVSRQS